MSRDSRWSGSRGAAAAAIAMTLGITALPGEAQAWGREGHRIIADIAETLLTSAAANQVRQLLDSDPESAGRSLADMASWADDLRDVDLTHQFSAWHFVRVPLDRGYPVYVPARDCAADQCLVAQLERLRAVLADRRQPTAERRLALLWVDHLVGDLMQPLHVSDDRDYGGNDVKILDYCDLDPACPPVQKWRSLHAMWDDGLIHIDMRRRGASADQLGQVLRLSVTRQNEQDYLTHSIREWLGDSLRQSYEIAYGQLPPHHPGYSKLTLGLGYVAAVMPTLEAQLQKGGLRLASLLNQSLR